MQRHAAGVRSGEGEPELKGILCQSTRLQYLISRRGRLVDGAGVLSTRIKNLSREVVRERLANVLRSERLRVEKLGASYATYSIHVLSTITTSEVNQ